MHIFVPRQNTSKLAAVALLAALMLLAGCLHRQHTHRADDNASVDIFLLTTNDLHGRLEPFTILTNQGEQTVGGFAGLAGSMNLIAQGNDTSVLRLNSGDTLTGPYAAQFKGEALFGALSRMGIDIATLGNHDFDRGPHLLAAALKHCSFPIVLTNIDIPAGHVLANTTEAFSLLKRAGKRLLVIGLLTPDLPRISRPGPEITVLDPKSAEVRLRIKKLIKQHKPDLVIALTHLGLQQDRQLAMNVPEIDIICGGHSHDLLAPGEELTVKHADGRNTVIVQAGAGGMALGVLRVRLRPIAQPTYTWLPQQVSTSSVQCPRMLAFIENYRSRLPQTRALATIDSAVDCRSTILRTREAPIGSFIADSLRAYYNTDIALYNGGGIRGEYMLPAGPITSMDVETMLPFGNTTIVVSMAGAMLRQVLEHSVAYLPQPWGGFLQVSGLRMRVASDQSITSVDIRRADGTYHPLDPAAFYRIATNTFLADGGNGYYHFKAARAEPPTRILIRDIIMRRLAAQKHHNFKTDGRITIEANTNNR